MPNQRQSAVLPPKASWTLRAHPGFAQSLYHVPRGAAGVLTDAIEALRQNPMPDNSEPIAQRPGRRKLRAAGYVVEYEMLPAENAIRLLVVQEEPPGS